jgi:hypothetical protein
MYLPLPAGSQKSGTNSSRTRTGRHVWLLPTLRVWPSGEAAGTQLARQGPSRGMGEAVSLRLLRALRSALESMPTVLPCSCDVAGILRRFEGRFKKMRDLEANDEASEGRGVEEEARETAPGVGLGWFVRGRVGDARQAQGTQHDACAFRSLRPLRTPPRASAAREH